MPITHETVAKTDTDADNVKSLQAVKDAALRILEKVDIIQAIRDSHISHREAASVLGVSEIAVRDWAKKLKTATTPKQLAVVEASIRKQDRIAHTKRAAESVKAGADINIVAKRIGVSARTLYRYVEALGC